MHLGRINEAIDWFERALQEAPDFAKAHAKRAWIATVSHDFGSSPTGAFRAQSLEHANSALELDRNDPEVLAFSGYAIGFLNRKISFGLELVERATDLSPSFAWVWGSSSLLCAYTGAAEDALERAKLALRLSPQDPFAFRTYVAVSLAQLVKGDFEALLQSGTKGTSLNPRPINFHYHRAIALAHLGRRDEALIARNRVLEIDPRFRIGTYLSYCRDEIGTSEILNRALEDGLQNAGFPQ
ncbi:MAG: tetratricopeptide repeat protein [Paracoccaceae bacterium]